MTPAPHFTQFGKYEIIRKLGRGMADVYLALDPDTNRRVVLKIIEQCRDSYTQIIVEAERRGAAIQQQLHATDPRILEIYDFGDRDGCFFVAMQYVEGRSLAEVLAKEGKIAPERAARYASEVCSQLATLHTFQTEIDGQKRAVVHGDIKPSNIQIGLHDEVWLLDFGIAKFISETRNLTSHNLGSPAYCSPERLNRAQVAPPSDLWAVGVCLYESIAGVPPYQAQTTRKLESLIQSRRPPRALPANCPAALKAIIWKALAADFEHRYLSAAAFQADLRSFLARQTTVAEMEKSPAWDVNATVEKGRQEPLRTVAPVKPRLSKFVGEFATVLWALIGGVLVGALLFVPAVYLYRHWSASGPLREKRDYTHATLAGIKTDWALYKKLERESRRLGSLSPVHGIASDLEASFKHAGDDIVAGYRDASEQPDKFDWEKARYCYGRVIELDSNAKDAKGGAALAEGYLKLARDGKSAKTVDTSFREAQRYLPKSPDPHLGLARVYAYGFHNAGQAVAEIHAAERLGFKAGPREFAQEADAYLFRAVQELRAGQQLKMAADRRRTFALAKRDFDRARGLYEPIAGFENVSADVERLDRDEVIAEKFRESSARPKPVIHKRVVARRRWR